ncbi:hypothetical protein ASPBRDRAFT_57462 [Aspergillus brasiliensis CBS 101740]|uniref:Uncharacterized protein n=1 Tax=Aspergillus brasiliensis (strain CBS 101740 / IMI 381727 / IBT 21946) TaxID=767769 RepID=A0A1L9UBB9_ASPBC|nr:hypothetical protein ASPBRDRAFT_57462 [Aspergillus brasiliensis CBS 101740]
MFAYRSFIVTPLLLSDIKRMVGLYDTNEVAENTHNPENHFLSLCSVPNYPLNLYFKMEFFRRVSKSKEAKTTKKASPPNQEEQAEKKSARSLGKIEGFRIPQHPDGWENLVQEGGLRNFTIKTLPREMFGSASKASNKQYVMLRCYSPRIVPPIDFRYHMSKFGFSKEMLERAAGLLNQSSDWAKYIRSLKQGIPTRELRDTQGDLWPGSFMAAKRLQEQTATVKGAHDRIRQANHQRVEKYIDAEDEATPNAALVVLLQEITHIVGNVNLEWVLNRTRFSAEFGDGRLYRACTDGAWRSTQDFEVFSIAEVKKGLRSESTIVQEACEIIAWMMTSPKSAVFESHCLLTSQDRHQIFLTFAKYEEAFHNYLKNNEATDKFLVMETFGPYDAEDPDCLEDLAKIIIAAVWIIQRSLSLL